MNIDLTKAWKSLWNGDPITDEELIAMILEAETALRYLDHRGESFSLATFKTRLDLEALHGFARARGLQVEGQRFPLYPDLLRADGTASASLFAGHVQASADKFTALRREEHHDSAEWNRLFEEHLTESAVEAVLSISEQRKPVTPNWHLSLGVNWYFKEQERRRNAKIGDVYVALEVHGKCVDGSDHSIVAVSSEVLTLDNGVRLSVESGAVIGGGTYYFRKDDPIVHKILHPEGLLGEKGIPE